MSGDGPIQFDADRIKSVVDVHNKHIKHLSDEYGGQESIPVGAYPPILDQHENDSNNRVVGRLTGLLKYEVRDVPKVGKQVPCAVAEGITFLGKEVCDRVKDGRIYHLSIGINEEDNSLGETSTVITPAAPGAMLLKKGNGSRKTKTGGNMSIKLKRMQAHQERLSTLSELESILTPMGKKLEATSKTVKLEAKKSEVTKRLSALCQLGKMTPAEYKNLAKDGGLARLAQLDGEVLNIALSAFDAREKPVVHVGQKGSTDAPDFSEIGKNLEKKQMKNLKSEIKKDFVKMSGKKLFGDEDKDHGEGHEMSGPKEAPVDPGKDDHSVPGQEGDEKELKHHMAALKKHLEDGDMEQAKESHKAMEAHCAKYGMKHMSDVAGDVKSEDEKKAYDSLSHEVDEVKTQMARIHGMVSKLFDAEKEEGHSLKKSMDKEEDEAEPASAAG